MHDTPDYICIIYVNISLSEEIVMSGDYSGTRRQVTTYTLSTLYVYGATMTHVTKTTHESFHTAKFIYVVLKTIINVPINVPRI